MTQSNSKRFIIKLVDKFFKFLGKYKVICCNSNCMIDKSVNCPENKINDKYIEEWDDEVFKASEDKIE